MFCQVEKLTGTALNPNGNETWDWQEVDKYIKKVCSSSQVSRYL